MSGIVTRAQQPDRSPSDIGSSGHEIRLFCPGKDKSSGEQSDFVQNELEDTPQVSPSQHKQAEGRFRLQVDRQTKATYATLEAAEAAGLAIKKSHPLVHVGVYDHLESVNKVIQLPEA